MKDHLNLTVIIVVCLIIGFIVWGVIQMWSAIMKDLYIDLWQRYPEKTLHNNQLYKDNCGTCKHFTTGLMYGIIPACGCKKDVRLVWALHNVCDHRTEQQTTLFDWSE